MMSLTFATFDLSPELSSETSIPLHLVSPAQAQETLSQLGGAAQAWAQVNGFAAKFGQVLVLPDSSGALQAALVGTGSDKERSRARFALGAARAKLPGGVYHLVSSLSGDARKQEYLGWLLAGYRFDRYAKNPCPKAQLAPPQEPGLAQELEKIAAAEALTRDLINTPSSDMGPAELEAAARRLADAFGAQMSVIKGQDLLDQNFPMIHAVGRASSRAPRLIDLHWGDAGPKLTLVGKGVCFDTGGLNLKPGSSMGLMKKDMGGAAMVLGLAQMIMSLDVPVQLRVLIPAVENSVSGNAFRPGDILTARNGLTVEVNNTDAEGRLVLADALALADEEKPDLVLSMATLTGAARVALGSDLAPFYSDDDAHVAALSQAATRIADPVWRMPFHAPYEAMIEPGIADLDNAPAGGFAGSITAALFLRRFVAQSSYMHFDIYGWNPKPAPARPKGGVGQGARAVLEALPEMLGF